MKRKRQNTRPLKRKRRLLCEALEDRRLLATLTVNSLADNTTADSVTTLREAIIAANATEEADTITFDSGLTGKIDLALGSILVNEELTITGPGADLLTIDARDNSRIFRSNAQTHSDFTTNR